MNADEFARATPYERAGIAWWNGLSHRERARWFHLANTCIVAEAFACYCALLDAFDGAETPVDLEERVRYHLNFLNVFAPS